jgi:hypothetical protein
MGDESIHKVSEAGSIRVALVQLDYQPSVILANPAIEEPSMVAEGEGITSLRLSDQQFAEQIDAMRSEIAKKYESFMRQRVKQILELLNNRSVDLVVFPEYSIPANCLLEINKYAGNYTVVAASHTVTPETIDICKKLNIEIGSSDIGKSICPIRLKGGQWQRIDKLSPSNFETNLKAGTIWQPIRLQNRNGKDFSFALFLCVDFINDNETNLQQIVQRDIWEKVDFGVVSSYSPTLRDFKQKAISLSERAGRPIIYANIASIGGSQIYCHIRDKNYFTERNGTKALVPGDEAILIVDLDSDQFERKPTHLPVSSTSELVALLPILPKEKFSKYHALIEKIHNTSSDETIREILKNELPELNGIIARESEASSVLKAKVHALIDGLKNKDGQYLKKCLECFFFTGDEESFDELRYELLFKAHDLLINIIKDTRVKGEDFDNTSEVIKFYRRSLDTLRPRISNKLLKKFDDTNLTIHTIVGDKASPTFTSVFVMRLRAARANRIALAKQINLITTLAYEGNDNLGINLRYRCLPNPNGNLKDLEIQILGAARADERSDSRNLANSFRKDLANIMRLSLQNIYQFTLEELEEEDLYRTTEPFRMNHIMELHREVNYEKQQSSENKIHHLEGNSSMARILDLLQSSSSACMVSIHLHPVSLTEAEKNFFVRYNHATPQFQKIESSDATNQRVTTQFQAKQSDGAMFFLATEPNPSLHMSDAITTQRLLGDSKTLSPSLLLRLFVASDEPLSKLFLNTIGNELWGDETYKMLDLAKDDSAKQAVVHALRHVWAGSVPFFVDSPDNLNRVPFLFDPYEASRMFRLPLDGFSGAVGMLYRLIPAPAAALPESGIEIGLGFHPGAQRPIIVRLSDEERTKHTYIVGKTGTGKSTLLSRMIEQDMRRGSGVCVIDPHGDLVDSVLAKVPDDRISDVVIFDPSSAERPLGLNLLEFDPKISHHKDFVVQETIAIMRKMFYFEHIGPIFEHTLRHLILTMLDESIKGEGTLIEVPRLIYDEKFRQSVVPNLKDELAADYWKQYSKLVAHTISEHMMYVVSKFDTFTTDHIMRNIIGQAHSTINIADIMNKEKILLVKLSSAVIGELNASLLGMIIISKLRWAGMARAAIPPKERKKYYLYVDEFQNFSASGFETLLAEARKYGLSLTLAHQHINQLFAFNVSSGRMQDQIAPAIFGNIGTMIAFRLGERDAELLVREMGKPVDSEDLVNLKNYHAIAKTIIDGDVYPPFSVKTLLSPYKERPQVADTIRIESLNTYGKPVEEVKSEIRERINRIIKGC